MRSFNLSHYLVAGPENCMHHTYSDIVYAAVRAGFTCVQVRSKTAQDNELIKLLEIAAGIIAELKKQDKVTLLINDRADIAKAAAELGIKVDGVHVGQEDMSPSECRKILGENTVIGLSAPQEKLSEYLETAELSCVDYFGIAPVHETETKKDLKKDRANRTIIPSAEEIDTFAKKSPLPVVTGGGVKSADLPLLAKTAVSGYFVVSAVCAAANPYNAACELVETWNANR